MAGEAELPSAPPAVARGDHPIARFRPAPHRGGAGHAARSSRCSCSSAPRCCRAMPPAPCWARRRRRSRSPSCARTWASTARSRCATSTGWRDSLHGDLGDSAAGYAAGSKVSIWDQVGTAPHARSLWLAGITALLMIPLSLLLGVVAARHAGRPADIGISTDLARGHLAARVRDRLAADPRVVLVARRAATGGAARSRPRARSRSRVCSSCPVLTLLGATLAASVRMTRAGMIQALRSDFAEMARLNGFPERRVVWRHALRNALAPAVQIFAQNLQYLIGGVIVVEYLFALPGTRQGARRLGRDPRRARGAVDRAADRGRGRHAST